MPSQWLGVVQSVSFMKSWNQTSPEILAECERRLLSHVGASYNVYTVDVKIDIQSGVLYERIHTFEIKGNGMELSVPVVIIHGFASGLATFVNLFKELRASCDIIYAIDILGFGRSSKPVFPSDSLDAECLFVDSIESWRIQMQLPAMVICAHSFGAYVATKYTQKYPNAVKGLILFEPWGFPYKSPSECGWLKRLGSTVNPLLLLKMAGPIAPSVMRLFTRDLFQKTFTNIGKEEEMFSYLYHSNIQCTGDAGFMALKAPYHHAKRPLSLGGLECSISLIYGRDSWIYAMTNLHESNAVIEIIPNAGHQIYADQPEQFIHAVRRALERI